MRNIPISKALAAGAILLFSFTNASAGGYATIAPDAPMSLVQDNSRSRTDDRRPRPQRYVCVVPARDTDSSSRPNVCQADAGRVGGRCRCNGVTGNGTLRFAN